MMAYVIVWQGTRGGKEEQGERRGCGIPVQQRVRASFGSHVGVMRKGYLSLMD